MKVLLVLVMMTSLIGCGADNPIEIETEAEEAVPAAGPLIDNPFDAVADRRTISGVVRFLYESKVDPEGYNPITIHCADDKFYEITFPEQLGPHKAEIFIGDFVAVKITEDWQHGHYTYDGNMWRNVTQRLVYFEDEEAIDFREDGEGE